MPTTDVRYIQSARREPVSPSRTLSLVCLRLLSAGLIKVSNTRKGNLSRSDALRTATRTEASAVQRTGTRANAKSEGRKVGSRGDCTRRESGSCKINQPESNRHA